MAAVFFATFHWLSVFRLPVQWGLDDDPRPVITHTRVPQAVFPQICARAHMILKALVKKIEVCTQVCVLLCRLLHLL